MARHELRDGQFKPEPTQGFHRLFVRACDRLALPVRGPAGTVAKPGHAFRLVAAKPFVNGGG